MQGQRLLHLIKDLDTSERKLLYYKAKIHGDKRLKHLMLLIGKKQQSSLDFHSNLENIRQQLSPGKKSEKIKNDQLRRFLDFSIKEIEDLKISRYIRENKIIRHYILSDVYNKLNTLDIYDSYLLKLGADTNQTKDYWPRSYYLNKMASLKLLSQTEEDFRQWRELVSQQINLLQSFYHSELAGVVEKIASSYVDDKTTLEKFNLKFLTEEYILKQIDMIGDHKIRSLLYLSIARFNIDNEVKFSIYSDEALRNLKHQNDKEAEIIRRKVYFAGFLHTFHFGYSHASITGLLNKILEINDKNKLQEPKIYFYLFLMQIIHHDSDGKMNFYNSNNKKYFTYENSMYFYNFLHALECYRQGDFKKTKRILNNLSFADNPYIESWAGCMEIATNYRQGEFNLTESLINKEVKRLNKLTDRFFTIQSSIVFICRVSEKLNIKIPKTFRNIASKTTKLSPFHRYLLHSVKA